jgi:hypothetical protein
MIDKNDLWEHELIHLLEDELKAANAVVKYLRNFDACHLMSTRCSCGCDTFKQTLNKYDEAIKEARRG